ncbi:MAG: metalloregulator ArsR/SmtB family transcription factor [Thermoanaerobaculia bacterium]
MMTHIAEEPALHTVFAALADETRLQLVGMLAQKDLCVCDLVDSLHDSQPKISRHLAYLRRAGIVTTERRGKWIRYRLCDSLPEPLPGLLPLLRSHAIPLAREGPACCPETGYDVSESTPITSLAGRTTAAERRANPRVLFLGSRNAGRSQMAEGLLRHMAGERFDVFSAGTAPGEMHPLAVEAMREIGIDISRQAAKTIDAFRDEHFEYVFGVCDQWKEPCPIFPSFDERAVLGVRDPAAVEGTEAERLAAFRGVRDELRRRLDPVLWA